MCLYANPVATTPKYNKDKVDNKVGFEFQGVSKTIEKGNKNITDHKVVEVVTFSLSLFLSFIPSSLIPVSYTHLTLPTILLV